MISTKNLIKLARRWISRRSSAAAEKGHFVVYTSDEERFSLPLAYLGFQVVRELLRMAEEEFGLSGGPITLPCDSALMDYMISMIQKSVARELEEALILSWSNFCCSH